MGQRTGAGELLQIWTDREERLRKSLWEKHGTVLSPLQNIARHVVAGSLAVLLSVTQPAATSILAETFGAEPPQQTAPSHTPAQLQEQLRSLLPLQVNALTPDQEMQVEQVLSDYFGAKIRAELNGMRLNRSYGYIGAEQHLMRFAGDTMSSHFATEEESQKFSGSGMAPGRGAWGYFAPSFEEMSQQDVEREKYYIAVQTFLSPGWHERTQEMYNFFKYRKMLIVNPENGKGMIVVIGDAGPAEWTGKHLGGSPEVMRYLERVDGAQKGPVLYFFIDDPDNTVPLGPIQTK